MIRQIDDWYLKRGNEIFGGGDKKKKYLSMCFEEKYLHPGRARGALGRGMVTYRAGQRAGLCCRRGHILADPPGTAGKDTHTHS